MLRKFKWVSKNEILDIRFMAVSHLKNCLEFCTKNGMLDEADIIAEELDRRYFPTPKEIYENL